MCIRDSGTTYEERAAQGWYARNPTSLQDNTRWCGLEVYDWTLHGKADPDFITYDRREIAGHYRLLFRIYGKQLLPFTKLPDPSFLADGDENGEGREWWYLVDILDRRYPVWWKVRADIETGGVGRYLRAWVVVDKTLCPVCLKSATDGDHQYCKREWSRIGWSPEGWPKEEK